MRGSLCSRRHAAFDEHVCLVIADNYTVVVNKDSLPELDEHASFAQFVREGVLVHGLEEARAERRVNLHRASDDGSGELFVFHEQSDRQTMSVPARWFTGPA